MKQSDSDFTKARKVWAQLPQGSALSAPELAHMIQAPDTRGTSSFLCQMVRRAEAEKDGKRDGVFTYKKKSTLESSLPKASHPETPSDEGLTELAVGTAIVTMIMKLRDEIQEQRLQLREERSQSKRQVEEIRRLRDLYDQAQQKIIALNTQDGGTGA